MEGSDERTACRGVRLLRGDRRPRVQEDLPGAPPPDPRRTPRRPGDLRRQGRVEPGAAQGIRTGGRGAARVRRSRRNRKIFPPSPLRRRQLRRPGHVRGAPGGIGRRETAGLLSRDPAHALRYRRRATPRRPLRPGRPGRRRETVRTRPRFGPGTEPDPPQLLRRRTDLPDRSLSRQERRAEPRLLPLRERLPRADLEPELRPFGPDHDGRAVWPGGARGVLRGGRSDPRRGPEPHAAGSRERGDGAAGGNRGRGGRPGRKGEGPEGDPAARSGKRDPWAVPGISPGTGSLPRIYGGDLRCAADRDPLVAMARGAFLHPRREAPPGESGRGGRDVASPAPDLLRPVALPRRDDSRDELSPVPPRTGPGDRPRGDGQTPRRGVRRRPGGAAGQPPVRGR